MVTETKDEKVLDLEVFTRTPHPEQQRFCDSTAKRKIIRAGRRGGKTVGIAIKAVDAFVEGRRVLYAAPTGEQTDRFWYEITTALRPLIDTGYYKLNETERYIEKIGTENRIKAKAQPLTAKVYTPDGYKLMGDIQVGDEVLTPFGTITKVSGVFPQGEQDIYEITFGDGCKTECTLDHLWEVRGYNQALQSREQFKVVTTEQLLNDSRINGEQTNISFRPRVRITEPVAFNEKPVPIEPYLLGALIGDGTLSKDCSPRISTADAEILNNIKGLLPEGMSIQHAGKYDYRLAPHDKSRKGKNLLLTSLKSLGLIGKRSDTKFIPDCYKYNSEDVRIKLIQGMLDADGSVSGEGRAVISQTSKQLADDISEVIQSLGGLCSTRKRAASYKLNGETHKCKDAYKQFIVYDGPYELFTLQRKKDRCKLRTFKNSSINRSICSIKFIKKAQAQCIMVEDNHQLYLTDSFIVTHNTAWNANTLRGDYADLLILDEWQLMAEDTWGDVGAPMMLDHDGDAVFIYTPPSLKSSGVSRARDPRHASKMFAAAQKDATGRWEAFHFTSFDNPHLSETALAEITTDMSRDSYLKEILAEDDEAQAGLLVYGAFDEKVCKVRRKEIPKHWDVFSGHDFGSANPAALFVAKDPTTGFFYCFREYIPAFGRSTYLNVQEFKKLVTLPGHEREENPPLYNVMHRVGGNQTTEDEIRQGYGAQGWPITAPYITKVGAQIDRAKSLVEKNKIFIFEDMHRLLEEINTCMFKTDDMGMKTNEIKDEKRFHMLACFRYLFSIFQPEVERGPEEDQQTSFVPTG